ncbi:transglycosylase domain-containing protein [uncultured Treponema sp.]|uniref:transglycosylase domain-containing protein n=1 Tax=uncultured Treponema sp. TaxID=162155 RepID=UPI0025D9F0AF|nr:transglycosylase domain-containing protein [uncultured Treponema sp.]
MKKNKFLYIIPIFLLITAIFFLLIRFSPYPELSEFKSRPVSTRVFDNQGKLIQIIALKDGLHREFTPLEDIPLFVQDSFIKAEDRHFYSHHGIDFSSVLRAIFQNVREFRTVSGASTITMQLARIIRPSQKRTIFAKIRETFDAFRLEARLSKKEILEAYLNNVPFGFNTEGVSSAARYFFSKELAALTEEEAKTLSQIPRRPSLYSFSSDSKRRPFSYPFEMPHFVRYLSTLPNSPIGKAADLHTTADLALQHAAEDMLRQSVEKYASNRLTNGAILICETQTGKILSWVGSADFFDESHNGQVDGVLSYQQPGSSMKPFLYALALEKGFSPSSVLPDIPMEFGFENLYVPQNFNRRFNGPVRLRVALASSLNIPAVYLLNEIGLDTYLKKLSELGFDSLKNADSGLSLALGGAEVSIFEMTQAFSVFARDGYFLPLSMMQDAALQNNESATNSRKEASQVYDVNTARLICDILSDRDSRALGFGYNQTFLTPFPAMFKTGTANQYQTITALGATPKYTVGIWMGNFSGETVIGKTGSSIPAKIARDLLVLLQGNNGKDFKKPAQFKKERICALSGKKAGEFCPDKISEYVATGSQDKGECCSWHTQEGTTYPAQYAVWFRMKNRSGEVGEKGSPLKIISPRNNSIFYYDDSVSEHQQKLVVEAIGGKTDRAVFSIDGTALNERKRPFTEQIPLQKGRHRIKVECAGESDEIEINVR